MHVLCIILLAARKSFIGQNKSIWAPLELIEKLCPESADMATSVRDMPGLKYVLLNGILKAELVLYIYEVFCSFAGQDSDELERGCIWLSCRKKSQIT